MPLLFLLAACRTTSPFDSSRHLPGPLGATLVAIETYLNQLSPQERASTCILGESRLPLPRELILLLDDYGLSKSCNQKSWRLLVTTREVEDSDPALPEWRVDLFHELPPCGNSWECWTGVDFQGIYTVSEVAGKVYLTGFQALVGGDGALFVSDQEYKKHLRILNERFGPSH